MQKNLARYVAALALALPLTAHSHDLWLKPSSTVLSAQNEWITVDAAVSNDKFYFNHAPLRLNGLAIVAPDGTAVQPENAHQGKLRSTFDLQLAQSGTYRIAVINSGAMARWMEDGKRKFYRGAAEGLSAVPEQAQDLQITQNQGRVETFVTVGQPTKITPQGTGLELVPVTHPNDLYAGEKAVFQLCLDGQPVAGLDVKIVPGGSRYRDQTNEMALKTGADGRFEVTWPQPGLYWVEATTEDNKVSVPRAQKRRLSYSGTLEVLAQ